MAEVRAVISSIALFMGLHCGGPQLPGLGSIKVEQLCGRGDVKRCDARGDHAVSTIAGGKASPIYLAAKQGPASYLGKVAPERNARSVLKTCGAEVVRDDWLASEPTIRVVELESDGKKSLRESIKGHIAQELFARPALLTGHEAQVESIVEAVAQAASLQKVSMVSQTYWLTDSAFEKRVAQCGEEEYDDIVYSLTLLQLSELSRKELEAKVYGALLSKLGATEAPADPAAPSDAEDGAEEAEATAGGETGSDGEAPTSPRALLDCASSAVGALANELRLIAAFGYDEK